MEIERDSWPNFPVLFGHAQANTASNRTKLQQNGEKIENRVSLSALFEIASYLI
jgi:hypothetical protein